jgi:uncharacterized protein (UPF0335 family)
MLDNDDLIGTGDGRRVTKADNLNPTGERLLRFIERIERLEEEKKAVMDDIKEVYQEAKVNGFDTKAIRQIIKLRKMSREKREEERAILDTYLHAIGMLDD